MTIGSTLPPTNNVIGAAATETNERKEDKKQAAHAPALSAGSTEVGGQIAAGKLMAEKVLHQYQMSNDEAGLTKQLTQLGLPPKSTAGVVRLLQKGFKSKAIFELMEEVLTAARFEGGKLHRPAKEILDICTPHLPELERKNREEQDAFGNRKLTRPGFQSQLVSAAA